MNGKTIIALDLETTGVDFKSDTILEFGAIKFKDGEVIATISQTVNPCRRIDPFVISLTGISQEEADAAPKWNDVKEKIADFLEDLPILGHNVSFDTAFMHSHGMKIVDEVYDTYPLSSIVLSNFPSYSLASLAEKFGVINKNPHRALSDAETTMKVFISLFDSFSCLEPSILQRFANMGQPNWQITRLARAALQQRGTEESGSPQPRTGQAVNLRSLNREIMSTITTPVFPPPATADDLLPVSLLDLAEGVFEKGGGLSKQFAAYETRTQQTGMAAAVAESLQNQTSLIVEAGTGVGKSLAYLVPALLYSKTTPFPVIVSTNTINLQQQLMNKDVKVAAASVGEITSEDNFKYAPLFGRSNYLCYRKWARATALGENPDAEADFLAKCLVWLETAGKECRGLRTELSLARHTQTVFDRFSAQFSQDCQNQNGPCFYRKATTDAARTDVLFINHALLIADIANSGGVLPPHSALIVDEAHNLQEAATRGLGFAVSKNLLENYLSRAADRSGTFVFASNAVLSSDRLNELERHKLENTIPGFLEAADASKQCVSHLFDSADAILKTTFQGRDFRISAQVRVSDVWKPVEAAWENFDQIVFRLLNYGDEFLEIGKQVFGDSASGEYEDVAATLSEISVLLGAISDQAVHIRNVFADPNENFVYWFSRRGEDASIQGAPLDVADYLKKSIFAGDIPVILTGASLTYKDNFERCKEDLGIENSKELVLDSPFDYKNSALVLVPGDVPAIGAMGHAESQAKAIAETARGTKGKVLALFTSHSSLRQARTSLISMLEREDFKVFGQGVDGSPQRVMDMLSRHSRVVVLGVASLWEGVDVSEGSLDALVVAKLPFDVPTDPLVAARTEMFTDGFTEYSIPRAVKRFRQGFGRLIRSKTDRGVFVVLDSRVLTRRYGEDFMRALPPCPKQRLPISKLRERVDDWLYG